MFKRVILCLAAMGILGFCEAKYYPAILSLFGGGYNYVSSIHAAYGTAYGDRGAALDDMLRVCSEGLPHVAARVLNCSSTFGSICRAVIDRENAPKKAVVPLLINGKPEIIEVLDSEASTLDLSVGVNGLKPGDILSMLNVRYLSHTSRLIINVGEGICFKDVSTLAGIITDLTVNGNVADEEGPDLTGCVNLKNLNVCGMKNIKSLNISNLASLSVLKIAGCFSLKDLNASGCKELTEISGTEELADLDTLNVQGTCMKNLDVSCSKKLQKLLIPGSMLNLKLPRYEGISVECDGVPPVNVILPGISTMFSIAKKT